MKKDVTKVIFRKFTATDDIIAIFPELVGTQDWENDCMSYMTIGQHGAASVDLAKYTQPCTDREYSKLKKELESLGYNLQIVRRIPKWAADIRSKQVKGDK